MRTKHFLNVFAFFALWILFCVYSLLNTHTLRQKYNDRIKRSPENYTGIKNKIEINQIELCEGCVNYKQYHVILGPRSEESRSEYLDLLIVVPSGYNRDAAHRRSVIRRTWANRSFYPQYKTRHVFVMGKYKTRHVFVMGKYKTRHVFVMGKYKTRLVLVMGKYKTRHVFVMGEYKTRLVFVMGEYKTRHVFVMGEYKTRHVFVMGKWMNFYE